MNRLDKHHEKTDNTPLQMGEMKGGSAEEAALLDNWVISFVAHLCHPSSGQAITTKSVLGHSGMPEYGTAGRELPVERQIETQHFPWPDSGWCHGCSWESDRLSWEKLKPTNTWRKWLLTAAAPLLFSRMRWLIMLPSENDAWEPNPPVFYKYRFSAQATDWTQRS